MRSLAGQLARIGGRRRHYGPSGAHGVAVERASATAGGDVPIADRHRRPRAFDIERRASIDRRRAQPTTGVRTKAGSPRAMRDAARSVTNVALVEVVVMLSVQLHTTTQRLEALGS